MIKLIVAVANNNLIGNGTRLPWHVPAELKFFKEMTLGKNVLMGGNTFKTLPTKLQGRKMIVMDQGDVPEADGVYNSIESTEEFINSFKESKEDLFIAGGKFIYEKFYPLADELYVSQIKGEFKGDVFLNIDFDGLGFKKSVFRDNEQFITYKYERK